MKNLVSLLLFTSLIFACTTTTQESSGKLFVVTTTGMLYDAVVNIGGDKVDAQALMGPGVDPHLYKATQGDLSKLNNADLIIYNGILLEGKMSEVLEKLSLRKPVYAAADPIPKEMLLQANGYEDAFDPHLWFDVNRWKYAVNEIGNALTQSDPTNKGYYQRNLERYLSQLDSLNSYVTSRVSELPENNRILVTAHDAFGYFGDAYGIQVEALQGFSTVADFGLKDIANIIDIILEHKIKAIFVETSVSEKAINAVVTGCREKGHDVVIGGSLFSDAMGELGTDEGTYIGMFKKNVNTIVDALK